MKRQDTTNIVRARSAAATDLSRRLLAAALEYVENFGWSLVPIAGDKEPPKGFRLKPRLESIAKADEVTRWFQRYHLSGIAVVCGRVSGNLVVRDFDDSDGYLGWRSRFHDLALRTPTVKTHRGYHVYFTTPVLKSREYADGEYRANLLYVLAPPSLHPQGGEYRWVIEPKSGELPFVADPAAVGLLGEDVIEPTEPKEPIEPAELIEKTAAIGGVKEFSPEILAAIRATLPAGPGKREKKLFELVRRLKAISQLRDAQSAQLVEIVRAWHGMALAKIGTKSFDETRLDFHRAWKNAILPAGAGGLGAILEAADLQGIPPEAERYDNPNVCRLAGLCREMQRLAGTGAFFLSCATIASLLNVTPMTAWRWLQLLELDGLLFAVKRGSPQSMRATRFRYSGIMNSG